MLKLALSLTVLLFIGCSKEEINEPLENNINEIIYLNSNSTNSRLSTGRSDIMPANTSNYLIEFVSTNLTDLEKEYIRTPYITTIGLYGYLTIDNKTEIWLLDSDATCTICPPSSNCTDCLLEVLEEDPEIETVASINDTDPRIPN